MRGGSKKRPAPSPATTSKAMIDPMEDVALRWIYNHVAHGEQSNTYPDELDISADLMNKDTRSNARKCFGAY